MLRHLFILTLALGFLAGAAYLSPAQAGAGQLPNGCIPELCGERGEVPCDCFNEKNDMRGCLEERCHDQGPVCSCAWISNNGNPLGTHTRLTDCVPGPIFTGESPQQVHADCDERNEIPIVTQEIKCFRFCRTSSPN